MTVPPKARPWLLALVLGLAVGFLAVLLSHKRDPFDDRTFWGLCYPLGILASGWMGYRYPLRPWRWPMVLFESILLALCIRNGEPGNLWPIAMVFFLALSVPGIIAAWLGSLLARR